MSIKDPQHNRLYAIACLTGELARVRKSTMPGNSLTIINLAEALYNLALTEEQWQEHKRTGVSPFLFDRSDANDNQE